MLRNLCIAITICLIAISCQKELSGEYGIVNGPGSGTGGGTGGTTNPALVNTWKFVGINSTGSTESQVSIAGTSNKVISNYVYNTIQNTGTLTFKSDGTMATNNFGYAVDTTAWTVTYFDGIFFDSTEVDLKAPYTATSGTGNYVLKGADSIRFTNGSLAGSMDGTMGYKITGNKLQLSVRIQLDSTYSSGGVTGYAKQRQLTYINFEK